jgi:predicted ATPase
MKYINKVEFKSHELFKDLDIKFKDLNIIVGNNASGKTTLLKSIHSKENMTCEPDNITNEVAFFDTEINNPRFIDPGFDLFKCNLKLTSREESHGETLLKILNSIFKEKDLIIFVDEPESGISLKNQFKMVKQLKKASKHNQLFISTHSYVIITSVKEVYDLDTKSWIKSEDYIEMIKGE